MQLIAEFSIDDLPRMTNAIGRAHWSFKHKERVKWQRLVTDQCTIHKISGLGLTSAALSLTRHSSKQPDYDGLVSGFKVVIDSIVKCGVLVDDKMSVIGMPKFDWVYRPTKQGGKITVRIEA